MASYRELMRGPPRPLYGDGDKAARDGIAASLFFPAGSGGGDVSLASATHLGDVSASGALALATGLAAAAGPGGISAAADLTLAAGVVLQAAVSLGDVAAAADLSRAMALASAAGPGDISAAADLGQGLPAATAASLGDVEAAASLSQGLSLADVLPIGQIEAQADLVLVAPCAAAAGLPLACDATLALSWPLSTAAGPGGLTAAADLSGFRADIVASAGLGGISSSADLRGAAALSGWVFLEIHASGAADLTTALQSSPGLGGLEASAELRQDLPLAAAAGPGDLGAAAEAALVTPCVAAASLSLDVAAQAGLVTVVATLGTLAVLALDASATLTRVGPHGDRWTPTLEGGCGLSGGGTTAPLAAVQGGLHNGVGAGVSSGIADTSLRKRPIKRLRSILH